MSLPVLTLCWGSRKLECGPSGLTIGRDTTTDVSLPNDGYVSRLHARVGGEGSEWLLQDLGSLNGTLLNGRRVTSSTLLKVGDTITVGATEIKVGVVAPAMPRASTPRDQAAHGRPVTRFRAKALPKPSANSCPTCKGRQLCSDCSGKGTVDVPQGEPLPCVGCSGSGRCRSCSAHVDAILSIVALVKEERTVEAEAAVHRALIATGVEESTIKNNFSMGGAAAGAGIALLVSPWILPLAVYAAKWVADEAAKESAPEAVGWKRADLSFLLAAMYHRQGRIEEARRALVQAVTYKEDHAPTLAALKEM